MMTTKIRNLLDRDGRYFARRVVPVHLRELLGRELRTPLGGERAIAIRRLHGALADFEHQIEDAEAQVLDRRKKAPRRIVRPRSPEQVAREQYEALLALDDDYRNRGPDYANSELNHGRIEILRKIAAGRATNVEMGAALSHWVEVLRQNSELPGAFGSTEWRNAMRLWARAEIDLLARVQDRDEGTLDDKGVPDFLAPKSSEAANQPAEVSIRGLFAAYVEQSQKAGKGQVAARLWAPVVEKFVRFIEHDNANLVERKDVLRWRDHLLQSLSSKTTKDVYLGALRAIYRWAEDNELVDRNPVTNIKVTLARQVLGRERGYNDQEATAVLRAAWNYQPRSTVEEGGRELAQTSAARRWAPLLCAYTGARITEITQLRKQDIVDGEIPYIRITPDAGSTKTARYLDVPIHSHLVEIGFMEFVAELPDGPLFYRDNSRTGTTHPSKMVAGKISSWVRSLGRLDKRVQPSHGWRHRLKTVGREIGVAPRVLDALQGHAARTAGDGYGDISLKAKKSAIELFPRFVIEDEQA
ncbi:hypothetical protein E8L99_07205 [Phreatobacter aquaticus]|uniref:Integrase n=1 Tax=Phreatobacter aquaticus TaxID=2570229 RepID=A0A4D7QII9_9HYPH|nr:tyrosine-type recombinase/integrase [Phreatobacter aquaticus]QCK85569.1 hypothetical protein E8L99_07205 [Phreatobacter aquaticus]